MVNSAYKTGQTRIDRPMAYKLAICVLETVNLKKIFNEAADLPTT